MKQLVIKNTQINQSTNQLMTKKHFNQEISEQKHPDKSIKTRLYIYIHPLLRLLSQTPLGEWESAQIIYNQVCCHSQDEDEAWRRHIFRLWTYCAEQSTI